MILKGSALGFRGRDLSLAVGALELPVILTIVEKSIVAGSSSKGKLMLELAAPPPNAAQTITLDSCILRSVVIHSSFALKFTKVCGIWQKSCFEFFSPYRQTFTNVSAPSARKMLRIEDTQNRFS